MDARRAVGVVQKRWDEAALATARAAMNEAKIALGECGPVWWTDGSPDLNRRMARTTSFAAWYRAVEDGAARHPKGGTEPPNDCASR